MKNNSALIPVIRYFKVHFISKAHHIIFFIGRMIFKRVRYDKLHERNLKLVTEKSWEMTIIIHNSKETKIDGPRKMILSRIKRMCGLGI